MKKSNIEIEQLELNDDNDNEEVETKAKAKKAKKVSTDDEENKKKTSKKKEVKDDESEDGVSYIDKKRKTIEETDEIRTKYIIFQSKRNNWIREIKIKRKQLSRDEFIKWLVTSHEDYDREYARLETYEEAFRLMKQRGVFTGIFDPQERI